MCIVALCFASCKKNYTCVCTTTANGVVIGSSAQTAKMTKNDAEAWCGGFESTAFNITTKCELE